MSVYYAAIGLLFGARAFFADRKGRTDLLYWAVLVALFVFAGFRWQVGCDWSGYARHYYLLPSRGLSEILTGREGGYWLMLETFRRLGLPYFSLNVATSIIFFSGLHWLARRQTDPLGFLVLAFPVLIINMPMSGIRQAAGVGFVCFALVAFIDRQPVRYLGWLLLGSLFHASTLIFLPFVTFIFGRFTPRDLLVALFLSLPVVYFVVTSSAADTAIERYVDTGVESYGVYFRLLQLALTAVVFFGLLNRNWARRYPADHGLVALGATLMILISLAAPFTSTITDRLGYYLVPVQLMILARLPFLFRGPSRAFFTFAPFLVMAMMFVLWTQNSRHFRLCYVPYNSVLAP